MRSSGVSYLTVVLIRALERSWQKELRLIQPLKPLGSGRNVDTVRSRSRSNISTFLSYGAVLCDSSLSVPQCFSSPFAPPLSLNSYKLFLFDPHSFFIPRFFSPSPFFSFFFACVAAPLPHVSCVDLVALSPLPLTMHVLRAPAAPSALAVMCPSVSVADPG